MRVLIVSIDHFVQRAKSGRETAALAARKNKLDSLLRREIAARNVRVIAEEAEPRYQTIAQNLANASNSQISWKNIGMNEDERNRAGILDALRNRPTHNEQRDNQEVEIEHRIPEDDIYEDFMVAETLQGAGEAESLMILCGDMHVQALKEKLKMHGHRVEKDESLITDKRWV